MRHVQLVKTRIGSFYLDVRDQFVSRALIEGGDYAPLERTLIGNLLDETSNVLWLGAHIGALVIPLSKAVKEVTAFEANPYTYRLLAQNLQLNDCGNVSAYNVAASDMKGELEFLCNVINSGGSKRMPNRMHPMYLDHGTCRATVRSVALDDFLKEHKFDLVFMDIEGSEVFALRGMPQVLEHCRVLVVEFLPHHLRNVAGVSIEDFVHPLRGFETVLSRSLCQLAHGSDIPDFLQTLFEAGHEDPGLIFHKKHVGVDWQSGSIYPH